MTINSQGRKKSNFPGATSVSSGAFLDYFVGGVNYKISYENFVAGLGVTGSIEQEGSVTGTPILDVAGTVNKIRNLEAGAGIVTAVSAENGAVISFNYTQDGTGAPLIVEETSGSLTFASLQEGDGIDLSRQGDVITISATGTLPATKTVSVNSISDFPTPVSGVITLEDETAYLISNDVSTSDRFVMGNGSAIVGENPFGAKLTYSGAGNMFSGTDKGGIFFGTVRIALTGGGTLFDISSTVPNTGALNMDNCIVVGGSIGTVSGYSTVNISNTSFVNMTQGITVAGTGLNTYTAVRVNFITSSASFLAIDLGTATLDSMTIEKCYMRGVAGSTFIDGLASSGNITSGNLGTIASCRFDGGVTPLAPGFTPYSDARWETMANDEIPDSLVDSMLSLPSSAGPYTTVISAVNTPVKINGTFVVERASKMTADATGRITFDGEKDTPVPIDASFSIEPVSGSNKNLALYVAKNGVVINNSERTVNVSSGSRKSVTIVWQETASNGDYYEIFVENETDDIDIKITEGVFRIN